jgi:hypothetical protein
MKKFILFSILVFVMLIFVSSIVKSPPNSASDPTSTAPDNILNVTCSLLLAIQQALTLIGDFTVQLLVRLWNITPSGMKFIIGLCLVIDRLLVLLGIATLKSGAGLWRRHVI